MWLGTIREGMTTEHFVLNTGKSVALQSLGHQMNLKNSKFLLILCILTFLGAGKRKFENICVCKTSTLGEQQGRSKDFRNLEVTVHNMNVGSTLKINLNVNSSTLQLFKIQCAGVQT